MDKITQIHSEYERLRDEINQADSRNYQIIGFVVAGAVALMAASFDRSGNPGLLSMFVFVLTIPAYLYLYGNRVRTWRLATYMRVFLEPELSGTRWESRLDEQRQRAKKERGKYSSLIPNAEWLVIAIINVTATSIACTAAWDNKVRFGAIVSVCLIVLFVSGAFSLKLRRLDAVESRFLKSWESLREHKKRI